VQNGKEIFVKSKVLRAFDSLEDCPTSYSILVQAWLGYELRNNPLLIKFCVNRQVRRGGFP
jgi:hypothetical protein